jgi:hypothetical protein
MAFLESRLRLKVNRQKSAVAPVGERQFLGHRLDRGGTLGIGRKSLARAKDRLREITRRSRGDCSLERMVEQVNRFITGWVTYYRYAQCKSTLRDLDGWLRRKLGCVRFEALQARPHDPASPAMTMATNPRFHSGRGGHCRSVGTRNDRKIRSVRLHRITLRAMLVADGPGSG